MLEVTEHSKYLHTKSQAAMKAELECVHEELVAAHEALQTTRADAKKAQRRRDAMEELRQGESTRLKHNLSRMASKLDDSRLRLRNALRREARTRTKVQCLRDELQQLNQTLKESEGQMSQQNHRIHQLEHTEADFKASLSAMHKQRDTLVAELRESRRVVKNLQHRCQ